MPNKIRRFGVTAVISVDDEDYAKLLPYQWTISDRGYPVVYGDTIIRMARLIMDAPQGVEVDHINGNKLDNRKINLRLVNHSENMWNTRSRKNGSSNYKGVHIDKHTGLWRSGIMALGKKIRSRRFKSEVEAAKWYDDKARELHGKYAYINFPI